MAKRTLQTKKKKKKWIGVYSSKDFRDAFLGELYTSEAADLKDKTLLVNLMELTGNPKNQNVNLKFIIEKVYEEKAYAIPISYKMGQSGIKRMIRRGKTRIDHSFMTTTSDGVKLRVKPLLVTRSKTKGSVTTTIRKALKQLLTKTISEKNYITFFDEILSYKLQRSLRSSLKKIYPLAVCEIRSFEIIGPIDSKDPKEEVKTEAPTEVKEEKPKEEVKKEIKEEKPEVKKKPVKNISKPKDSSKDK